MMLKQDFLVKQYSELHLESFCSGNLIPFQLEQRDLNWNGTRFEWSRKNLHSTQLSRAVRGKISISPMPCRIAFQQTFLLKASLLHSFFLIQMIVFLL